MTAPIHLPLPHRYRTLFLSDVHLGSKNCQAAALAAFLSSVDCQRLYLVGDIIDFWWMSTRRANWDTAHSQVIERLHDMARRGVELIYVPGNHDRPARRFCGLVLPTMQVRRRAIHRCADGRRLLVTHGDEFDATTRLGGAQEWLGELLYVGILAGNRMINRIRLRLGMRYWSLSEFLKRQSRAAEHYIQRYAQAGLASARQRGLDGIVCGHIHRPALADVDGMVYANDGDWVENLSALAEHTDGTLSLLHWNNEVRVVHSLPRSAAADLRIAA